MNGLTTFTLLKYAAVLIASIIIGNWFLGEVKKAKITRAPWYKPYISLPGLLILAALLLPLVLLILNRQ